MTLYLKITKDRYELPLAVETSEQRLAERVGVGRTVISHALKRKKSQYIKIEVEEQHED